jgi:N-acetylated-alpha-linked acidic dipeptidase
MRMPKVISRRPRHFCHLALLFQIAIIATGVLQPLLSGFTPTQSQTERTLEARFTGIPNPERAEAEHKALTVEPHIAGGPGDRRTAEYVLNQLRGFGLEAEIEEVKATVSLPRKVKFYLLDPVKFSGPNAEFVAEDPSSKDLRTSIGFNAYSGSGDVAAQVVYVNYGLRTDYEYLRSIGISVVGKIAIARYGNCYRGLKAKVAEENKAAGLIIYSDPLDDGYHIGDSYPAGPWRPPSGVQRGSVLYEFIYPGSVATDGSNVPHLPIMPLSYNDAQHILANLGGAPAPPEWQGGLPFTYHLGPGRARVRMQVQMSQIVRPIWNVIAKIRGTQNPEEIVLVGNHRDAWTFGGVDPNSGTTAMLEMARGFGVLLKEGWRPRRSIWICSWDGEELGEFGSVSWAENHANDLESKAVAYLNTDSTVSGDRLSMIAAPSLKKFVAAVAADVPDPAGGSLLERADRQARERLSQEIALGGVVSATGEPKPIAQQRFEVGNLSGGTDYIAFFNHLGFPSAQIQFVGPYGVYHSIFDNHRWMKRFGDPKFVYHVAAARLLGLMTMRLADTDLLPLDYEAYGQEIERCLEQTHNKLVILGEASRLDLQAAQQAARELTEAGREFRDYFESRVNRAEDPPNLYQVNRALVKAEQAFLLPEGLPGRPWYKHAVFAPSTTNGDDTVALPGVQDSADAGNFEEAQRQVEALATALNRATAVLQGVR